MPNPRVTAFVLAGGAGTRLRPLTEQLPKPALPVAEHCRVIDFALANLRHSRVSRVYVLLQYKPMALLEHLHAHWPEARARMPAVQADGTAGAVAQALAHAEVRRTDVIAVLAADHICRLDLRQMVALHQRRAAGVTVAATAAPTADAREYGVLDIDAAGRITQFHEKPSTPRGMPDDPSQALVSMGNYVFDPAVLARELAAAGGHPALDFGRDVIPSLVRQRRAFAYDFRTQRIPGLRPGEQASYWRDVGSLQSFAQAQADVGGPCPRLDLRSPGWPIPRTLPDGPAQPSAADLGRVVFGATRAAACALTS